MQTHRLDRENPNSADELATYARIPFLSSASFDLKFLTNEAVKLLKTKHDLFFHRPESRQANENKEVVH